MRSRSGNEEKGLFVQSSLLSQLIQQVKGEKRDEMSVVVTLATLAYRLLGIFLKSL